MSLKPPSLWIEKRGHQHRVYWRNTVPGLPARSYVPFHGRDAAEQFVGMAGLLGLATARQVLDTDDPLEATALLQADGAWCPGIRAGQCGVPAGPSGRGLRTQALRSTPGPRMRCYRFRPDDAHDVVPLGS